MIEDVGMGGTIAPTPQHIQEAFIVTVGKIIQHGIHPAHGGKVGRVAFCQRNEARIPPSWMMNSAQLSQLSINL
jgi:hypothetical protein